MSGWSDADGRPVAAPEPPAQGSFYGLIGDFQGPHYERNAFTRGTRQEVAFLMSALSLSRATTVLDVGCGTGRHARALRDNDVEVVGLDLSYGLLRAAADRRPGGWVQADARRIPLRDECVDVVLSLCQGGFGISAGGDAAVLSELVRVLRPGGGLALTAFSLAFASRWLANGDALDVDRGLHWAPADVRGPDATQRRFDLWTQCYSAGHLRCLSQDAGLEVAGVFGVEPGSYGRDAPALSHPELLVLATKRPG